MASSRAGNGAQPIGEIIDLARYPIDELGGDEAAALIARCRDSLAQSGSFSLAGFLRLAALSACVGEIAPLMTGAFHHTQQHNIYFDKSIDLPPGHAALAPLTSSNHTVACDRLAGTVIRRVYEWPPLAEFLAAVLDKPRLYLMADPLARLNVMPYGPGDQLGWHFDRAQFSVTLLLQAAEAGGVFQYRRNLRSAEDPNYDGVGRLLAGADDEVCELTLTPGTLNVFAGRYAAHRVTPVEGSRPRLMAVLSFMEEPDVTFCAEDRIQFYGRAG